MTVYQNVVCVVLRKVVDKTPYFLLLQRNEGKSHPMRWHLPGGKVNDGEPLHKAVIRELVEETGLECDPTDMVLLGAPVEFSSWGTTRKAGKGKVVPGTPKRFHGFLIEHEPGDKIEINSGNCAYGWFTKGRIGAVGALEPSSLFVNRAEGTAI